MSKVTLTPKLFPVLFAAGTVAGPIVYALLGAKTGFAASQSGDGTADVAKCSADHGGLALQGGHSVVSSRRHWVQASLRVLKGT